MVSAGIYAKSNRDDEKMETIMALAWVMGRGDYITVLNGCSKIQQIEENIKADKICLTKSDSEWMQNLAEEIQ